jgi:AraC-like DNA-binding protein
VSADSSCTVLAALPQLQLMFGLQHGVTPDQLCRTAAVSPLELVDRDRMVPYGWYRALWDALEQHCSGIDVGVELGLFITLDHLGYVGQLLRHALSGLDLLQKLSRFAGLINSRNALFPARVELRGERVELVIPRELIDFPACLDATAFATLLQLRSLLGASLRPQAAHFHQRRGALEQRYAEFLGCPIAFEGTRDSVLVFSRSELEAPIAGKSPELAARIEAWVHAKFLGGAEAGFLDAAARAIDQQLQRGELSEAGTAAALGLSVRSFQRKLLASDASYRQLCESRRRAAAERLLGDPALAVYEVAYALG